MSKDIGMKIKTLRKSRKITQEQLAEKVDIKRSTISNYEIGRRTPHLKDLQKLAHAFGVGLDYFGIYEKDEALDLLARAEKVFKNPQLDKYVKEKLYVEIMRLYLDMKEELKK